MDQNERQEYLKAADLGSDHAPPDMESQEDLGIENLTIYWDSEHDRLRAIGQLTEVPGKLVPIVMAILFALVVGYHPWLSPAPMPTSLLVLISLSVVVFLFSALSLRWHFQKVRDDSLAQLKSQLSQIKESVRDARKISERLLTKQGLAREDQGGRLAAENQGQLATDVKNEPEADPREALLTAREEQIVALADGVFQPWNRSPIGLILGSGVTIALVDLWARWWMILG